MRSSNTDIIADYKLFRPPFKDTLYNVKFDTDEERHRDKRSEDPRAMSSWRAFHYEVAKSMTFRAIIMITIIVNVAAIILESLPEEGTRYGFFCNICDRMCLGIFLFEAGVNIIALHTKYFKQVEHLMDFFILILSCCELLERPALSFAHPQLVDRIFSKFRVLRSLRLLRALRLFGRLSGVRRILVALRAKWFLILAAFLWIFIVLHVASTIAVVVYYDRLPDYFANYGTAFITMLRVMLRAQWSEIAAAGDYEALSFLSAFVILGHYWAMMMLVAVFTYAILTGQKDVTKKEQRNDSQEELGDAYFAMVRDSYRGERGGPDSYEKRRLDDVLAMLPLIEHVKMVNIQTRDLISECLVDLGHTS